MLHVKKTSMIQLEKRSLLSLCQLEKIEHLLKRRRRHGTMMTQGLVYVDAFEKTTHAPQ